MILSFLYYMPIKEHLTVDEVRDMFLCNVESEKEAFDEMKHFLDLLNIDSGGTFTQLFDLHDNCGKTIETIKFVDMIAGSDDYVFIIRDGGNPHYKDIKHFLCDYYRDNIQDDFDEWSINYNSLYKFLLIYYKDLCKRKGDFS